MRALGACLVAMILISSNTSNAAVPAGKAVSVSGTVLIRNEDQSNTEMRSLQAGMAVEQGTVINTSSNGSAKLLLSDKSIIDLGPSTLFKVKEYQLRNSDDRQVSLAMAYGKIRASVNKPVSPKGRYLLRTRSATMGVRGTEFVVASDIDEAPAPAPAKTASRATATAAAPAAPKTQITVIHGKVEVTEDKATRKPPVALTAGTQMTTAAERTPAGGTLAAPKIVKLSTEEVHAVQVAARQEDHTFVQAVVIDRSQDGASHGSQTLAAVNEAISLPHDSAPAVHDLGLAGTFGTDMGLQHTAPPVHAPGEPVRLHVVFKK